MRLQRRADQNLISQKLAELVGGRIRIRDQPPLIFHPDAAKMEESQSIIREVFLTIARRCPMTGRCCLPDIRSSTPPLRLSASEASDGDAGSRSSCQ